MICDITYAARRSPMGNNRAQPPLFWPITPDSSALAWRIFAGLDLPPVARCTAAGHRLISPRWHSGDALHGHKFGQRLLLSHRQRHRTLRTSRSWWQLGTTAENENASLALGTEHVSCQRQMLCQRMDDRILLCATAFERVTRPGIRLG